MKLNRYLHLILLVLFCLFIQSCGSGTGASDTNGALTVTTPTATALPSGNEFSVSSTITFTPPAGKTAQGVQVDIVMVDQFGLSYSNNVSFTTNSNTVTIGHVFPGPGNAVSVAASIGDMRSSSFVAF